MSNWEMTDSELNAELAKIPDDMPTEIDYGNITAEYLNTEEPYRIIYCIESLLAKSTELNKLEQAAKAIKFRGVKGLYYNYEKDINRQLKGPGQTRYVDGIDLKGINLPDYHDGEFLPTMANLKAILDAYGITTYYDVVLRRTISLNESGTVLLSKDFDNMVQNITNISTYVGIRDFKREKRVRELLGGMAGNDQRNIPLDRIKNAAEAYPEDAGEIRRLFECFTFNGPEKPHYYPVFCKWLAQIPAMLQNNQGKYGPDFILVLQGGQGIGKTYFGNLLCRPFGSETYYRSGLKIDDNKDSIDKATACVIGEIGEGGRTMKYSDTVKAFITEAQDIYRAAYGHTTEANPRLSTYYMTVNDDQFLRDETGNRRFVVFPLLAIDHKRISDEINMDAVYAEAYRIAQADPSRAFRLTPEEREAVQEAAKGYLVMSPEEIALRDMLLWGSDRNTWIEQTSQQITARIQFRPEACRSVGRALKKMGYSNEPGAEFSYRTLDGRKLYRVPNGFMGQGD